MTTVIKTASKVVTPLLLSEHCRDEGFVRGVDEHGPYVACRLGNRDDSILHGWYFFVSLEDLPLAKQYNWRGRVDKRMGTVEVRRTEYVAGKNSFPLLSREIWERMYPERLVPSRIQRLGHTLDFRRVQLSTGKLRKNCQGVYWCKRHKRFHASIFVKGELVHLGKVSSPEDGYRIYNRHLQELKKKHPEDPVVQRMPYNEITPQF